MTAGNVFEDVLRYLESEGVATRVDAQRCWSSLPSPPEHAHAALVAATHGVPSDRSTALIQGFVDRQRTQLHALLAAAVAAGLVHQRHADEVEVAFELSLWTTSPEDYLVTSQTLTARQVEGLTGRSAHPSPDDVRGLAERHAAPHQGTLTAKRNRVVLYFGGLLGLLAIICVTCLLAPLWGRWGSREPVIGTEHRSSGPPTLPGGLACWASTPQAMEALQTITDSQPTADLVLSELLRVNERHPLTLNPYFVTRPPGDREIAELSGSNAFKHIMVFTREGRVAAIEIRWHGSSIFSLGFGRTQWPDRVRERIEARLGPGERTEHVFAGQHSAQSVWRTPSFLATFGQNSSDGTADIGHAEIRYECFGGPAVQRDHADASQHPPEVADPVLPRPPDAGPAVEPSANNVRAPSSAGSTAEWMALSRPWSRLLLQTTGCDEGAYDHLVATDHLNWTPVGGPVVRLSMEVRTADDPHHPTAVNAYIVVLGQWEGSSGVRELMTMGPIYQHSCAGAQALTGFAGQRLDGALLLSLELLPQANPDFADGADGTSKRAILAWDVGTSAPRLAAQWEGVTRNVPQLFRSRAPRPR